MEHQVVRWSSIPQCLALGTALAGSVAGPAGVQTGRSTSPTAPALEITAATVAPAQVFTGDSLRIDATVTNGGGPSGPFVLVLRLETRELGRQPGDLAANAAGQFTFRAPAPDRVGRACFELAVQSPRGDGPIGRPRPACVTIQPKLARAGPPVPKMPGSSDSAARGSAPGALGSDSSGHGSVALKVEPATKKQALKQSVRALGDDARIQLTDGRILTKRELLSQVEQRHRQHLADVDKPGDGAAAFAAAKSAFDAQQTAKLADLPAKMAAEMKRLESEPATIPSALEAIRLEARELMHAYSEASGAKKAQIEARAAVLMAQAKQLLKP
jgi:hypothetical protein